MAKSDTSQKTIHTQSETGIGNGGSIDSQSNQIINQSYLNHIIKNIAEVYIKEFDKFKKQTTENLRNEEEKVEKLTISIDKQKAKSIDIQDKLIQTLGIFTALFTFVSIEFKFLNQTMCMTQLIALSTLLLFSLVIFVLLLGLLTHGSKITYLILIFTSLILVGIGLGLYPTFENSNKNCRILKSIEDEQKSPNQPINNFYLSPTVKK